VTLAREIRLAELEKKKKISRIETEAAKFEAVIGNHFIRKYKMPM
jgi:hypothetical protein